MEILHFPRHHRAETGNLKCEFCSQIFQMFADKNAHILSHFSKENCMKCDQDLIRIGENLYVLHSTVTCIASKPKRKKKKKSKELKKNLDADRKSENTEFSAYDEQNSCSLGDFEVMLDTEESVNPLIGPENVEVNVVIEKENEEIDEKQNEIAKPVDEKNRNEKIQSRMCLSVEKQKRKRNEKSNDIFFKCEYDGCDKLIRKSNKRQHMTTHTDERFECDICHSSLASKNGLRAHFYLHFPKKELKCTICGLTYRSESSLSQHVRFVHNKEPKRFICNVCGRALRKSHLLKEHINKHNGEKPFDCPYDGCEKRFYTKTHRKEHLRSHTGERPYKCSMEGCYRQFAYAIDFKRHKFKAHGIYANKFPCPICSKIFPENMLLKKHLKSHEINYS
ncbi:zinc finger protein 510-like [Sitodiplosis mosellana]|uniref:zinc finger protein 510-like n=1 Tax=Sitodiplosis mosellana TaxID=263140 RepID=UPI002444E34D|nr:zinc finger protein 510-like [Sitodiplosis mosellana]